MFFSTGLSAPYDEWFAEFTSPESDQIHDKYGVIASVAGKVQPGSTGFGKSGGAAVYHQHKTPKQANEFGKFAAAFLTGPDAPPTGAPGPRGRKKPGKEDAARSDVERPAGAAPPRRPGDDRPPRATAASGSRRVRAGIARSPSAFRRLTHVLIAPARRSRLRPRPARTGFAPDPKPRPTLARPFRDRTGGARREPPRCPTDRPPRRMFA